MPSSAAASALHLSLNGTGYLFTSSLLQKLLSFALGQVVQQSVSASAFGFAETRMTLFIDTALFISREGARLTALRAPLGLEGSSSPQQRAQWQQLSNLAWLPLPIALALVGVSVLGWDVLLTGAGSVQGAGQAMLVYFLVVVVEALAEPAYILTSAMLRFKERAGTEAAAAMAQSITVFALVRSAVLQDRPALAFALGALASALVKLAGFWGALLLGSKAGGGGLQAYGPRWLPGGLAEQLGQPQLALLRSFFLQGLLKHVLTQADKVVQSSSCSLEEQGNYRKVDNLGSLAPRIIFSHIEETLRGLVSKLLPHEQEGSPEAGQLTARPATGSARAASPAARKRRSSSSSGSSRRSSKGAARRQPSPASSAPLAAQPPSPSPPPAASNLALAATVLAAVTHLVLLLGLLIAGLGSACAPLALALLRGGRPVAPGQALEEGSRARLLSLYCLYVLTLALNGVTEAFATAAATPARLRTASLHYTAIAGAGAGLMLALIPAHGLAAMLAVNSLSMLARTASSLGYARQLLLAQGLQPGRYAWAALPSSALTLPFLGLCFALGHAGQAWGAGRLLLQLGGAGVVGGLAVGGLAVLEGRRLRETWRLLRSK